MMTSSRDSEDQPEQTTTPTVPPTPTTDTDAIPSSTGGPEVSAGGGVAPPPVTPPLLGADATTIGGTPASPVGTTTAAPVPPPAAGGPGAANAAANASAKTPEQKAQQENRERMREAFKMYNSEQWHAEKEAWHKQWKLFQGSNTAQTLQQKAAHEEENRRWMTGMTDDSKEEMLSLSSEPEDWDGTIADAIYQSSNDPKRLIQVFNNGRDVRALPPPEFTNNNTAMVERYKDVIDTHAMLGHENVTFEWKSLPVPLTDIDNWRVEHLVTRLEGTIEHLKKRGMTLTLGPNAQQVLAQLGKSNPNRMNKINESLQDLERNQAQIMQNRIPGVIAKEFAVKEGMVKALDLENNALRECLQKPSDVEALEKQLSKVLETANKLDEKLIKTHESSLKKIDDQSDETLKQRLEEQYTNTIKNAYDTIMTSKTLLDHAKKSNALDAASDEVKKNVAALDEKLKALQPHAENIKNTMSERERTKTAPSMKSPG